MHPPVAQLQNSFVKFASRLSGRLKEWWINLGAYRQLQALQSTSVDAFMTLIHTEFL